MYKNMLKDLVCPVCREKLSICSLKEINGEVIKGSLYCDNNHTWRVEEGVVDFKAKEQDMANKWSESYEQMDYDELDRKVREGTPQIQLDAQKKAKEEIINLIDEYQPGRILDIGTGRGMLLIELVKYYGNDIDLVCVDLSFEVLKYDRLKALKINPGLKINYIACDAAELPFLSHSFGLAVSYFGIQNMLTSASKGVKEGVRVSQNGLVDVGTVIRDDNPKIDMLNKLLAEHGYNFNVKTATETHFYKTRKIDESYQVNVKNIFEGIAEKNDNDLIPIEGEWFAISLGETIRRV